jgi:hypothetical protein
MATPMRKSDEKALEKQRKKSEKEARKNAVKVRERATRCWSALACIACPWPPFGLHCLSLATTGRPLISIACVLLRNFALRLVGGGQLLITALSCSGLARPVIADPSSRSRPLPAEAWLAISATDASLACRIVATLFKVVALHGSRAHHSHHHNGRTAQHAPLTRTQKHSYLARSHCPRSPSHPVTAGGIAPQAESKAKARLKADTLRISVYAPAGEGGGAGPAARSVLEQSAESTRKVLRDGSILVKFSPKRSLLQSLFRIDFNLMQIEWQHGKQVGQSREIVVHVCTCVCVWGGGGAQARRASENRVVQAEGIPLGKRAV